MKKEANSPWLEIGREEVEQSNRVEQSTWWEAWMVIEAVDWTIENYGSEGRHIIVAEDDATALNAKHLLG
jgi:hypothetical protein